VIDGAGYDIPGLYAAGRTAIGVASSRYVSGLSLADCVFSGRRAGKAAALEGASPCCPGSVSAGKRCGERQFLTPWIGDDLVPGRQCKVAQKSE
jgi:succinate dehydrogenase/fumarate reductase flavoprotein subunit